MFSDKMVRIRMVEDLERRLGTLLIVILALAMTAGTMLYIMFVSNDIAVVLIIDTFFIAIFSMIVWVVDTMITYSKRTKYLMKEV